VWLHGSSPSDQVQGRGVDSVPPTSTSPRLQHMLLQRQHRTHHRQEFTPGRHRATTVQARSKGFGVGRREV